MQRSTEPMPTEHLFSYGTLQLEFVQRELLECYLSGHRDIVRG